MMSRVIAFSLPLMTAAASFAEHGGGRVVSHGEAHVSNWFGIGPQYAETPALGFVIATFLIFAGGLVYFVRPKLMVHLENRSDDVRKAIEEATRAKDAAEARAREAEEKLARLADDMKQMKVDFEVQGKSELERLEKLAHQTAARIAKDAEDTIAAESVRAQQMLRAEAARLALDLAEQKIRTALSADDDVRLQAALVAGLEKASGVDTRTSAQ